MLLEFVFATMCAQSTTVPYEPCYKSLEAASIQSEFKPKVREAEIVVEKSVRCKTGDDIWIVGGIVAQVYKKQLSYGFDTKEYGIDRTNVNIGEKNNGLGLYWDF